ncbi:hypothetical protein AB8J25_002966 [Clostridium perfringens]
MQNLKKYNNYIPTFGEDVDPFKNCVVENWSDKVKRLRKTYIKEDVDTIIRFLKKVHPELEDVDKRHKYGNIGIELRIIDREFEDKKGAVIRKSMVLYDFSTESIRMFKNWYNKNVKNKAVCMYYSISNFFSNSKNWSEDGKQYSKGRINAQNACFSSTVVLDFDNILECENKSIDNKLISLGLNFDSIRTSFNGWQKVFYLKEPCWDKEVIPKFTKLFLSRGFNVDECVNNKAQVARVLGSVNNKCFSGKCTDRLEQFKVTREKRTNTRVNILELWETIEKLEIVDDNIEVKKLNLDKPLTDVELKDKITIDFNKQYGDVISNYWIKAMPIAIKKMFLDRDNEGYTNDFLMFIVAHIKNTMKVSRDDFKTIMDRWADITKYNEREKYLYIWDKYGHKDKDGIPFAHGKYTKKLAQRYGAIDFNTVKEEYKNIKNHSENFTVENCDNKVILNGNVIRDDAFKHLTDGAMQVFICIMVQRVLTQKEYVYSNEIIGHRLLKIKERQTKQYLSELVKLEYLKVIADFKGKGKLKYIVKKEYTILTATRNLAFHVHEAQRMLEVLKPNEIKFYILLKSLVINKEVKNYNMTAISTMLGVTTRTVRTLKKSLQEKGFILVKADGFDVPNKYIIFS